MADREKKENTKIKRFEYLGNEKSFSDEIKLNWAQIEGLQVSGCRFFGKMLFLDLWAKMAENVCKIWFFKFYEKSEHDIFWNFCINLQQNNVIKLN